MASENTRWLVKEQGGPLEVSTAAKPDDVNPNEVMIRLKAIAINPADCKMIDHAHRGASYPMIPGLDGSGVLDVAREMKLRVKNWAYAYHLTNETKYADRAWLELQVRRESICIETRELILRPPRATIPTFRLAQTTARDGTRLTFSTSPSFRPCLPSATTGCTTTGMMSSETS